MKTKTPKPKAGCCDDRKAQTLAGLRNLQATIEYEMILFDHQAKVVGKLDYGAIYDSARQIEKAIHALQAAIRSQDPPTFNLPSFRDLEVTESTPCD